MEKIPRNINDISQKIVMNLFKDKKFSLFGVKTPKLVESLNVELADVRIEERRTDLVFLLEDDSLLHLEFQTNYRKLDLIRFILYDILLHKQHKQRKVTTVIIYSAKVKRKKVALNFKTLSYHPYVIFLEEKNAEEVLQQLEEKILNKKPLTDENILNLAFTSFMKSDIIEINKKAIRQLKVANHIEDHSARESVIASIIGVASKFLNHDEMKELREVFIMKDIFREWMDEEIEEAVSEAVSEAELKTARKMLKEKLSFDLIARITNLCPKTIQNLQQ